MAALRIGPVGPIVAPTPIILGAGLRGIRRRGRSRPVLARNLIVAVPVRWPLLSCGINPDIAIPRPGRGWRGTRVKELTRAVCCADAQHPPTRKCAPSSPTGPVGRGLDYDPVIVRKLVPGGGTEHIVCPLRAPEAVSLPLIPPGLTGMEPAKGLLRTVELAPI